MAFSGGASKRVSAMVIRSQVNGRVVKEEPHEIGTTMTGAPPERCVAREILLVGIHMATLEEQSNQFLRLLTRSHNERATHTTHSLLRICPPLEEKARNVFLVA
jgi:hypothetical protein